MVKTAFGGLKARGAAPPGAQGRRAAAQGNAGQRRHRSRGHAVVGVARAQAAAAARSDRSRDYRRDLVQRFFEQMLNERFDEIYAPARREVPRRRHRRRRPEQGRRRRCRSARASRTARSRKGSRRSRSKPSARASSASARGELDRAQASGWRRSTSAPTPSATRPRAARSRRNTSTHFLEGRAEPGHRVRVQARAAAAAGHHRRGSHRRSARRCSADDSRVILATSPQKAGIKVPTEAELKARARGRRSRRRSPPWNDTTSTRELIEHKPEPAAVTVDAHGATTSALTIVRFANGVEAWLKPTDFKNDQVVFTLQAKGGHVARAAGRLSSKRRWRPPTSACRARPG